MRELTLQVLQQQVVSLVNARDLTAVRRPASFVLLAVR